MITNYRKDYNFTPEYKGGHMYTYRRGGRGRGSSIDRKPPIFMQFNGPVSSWDKLFITSYNFDTQKLYRISYNFTAKTCNIYEDGVFNSVIAVVSEDFIHKYFVAVSKESWIRDQKINKLLEC